MKTESADSPVGRLDTRSVMPQSPSHPEVPDLARVAAWHRLKVHCNENRSAWHIELKAFDTVEYWAEFVAEQPVFVAGIRGEKLKR